MACTTTAVPDHETWTTRSLNQGGTKREKLQGMGSKLVCCCKHIVRGTHLRLTCVRWKTWSKLKPGPYVPVLNFCKHCKLRMRLRSRALVRLSNGTDYMYNYGRTGYLPVEQQQYHRTGTGYRWRRWQLSSSKAEVSAAVASFLIRNTYVPGVHHTY